METLRTILAILTAKLIATTTRTFLRGGGTAAPGLYALKISPTLIHDLSKDLRKGTIVVAGTNGKTTSSRMIATMLSSAGISYIHNKEGSNLLRGFASSLATATPLFGKSSVDYALWEVDEATLPQLLKQVTPKVIVLTNLFRDQLDRYGEVAKIRSDWEKAIAALPHDTTLIVNADDPSLAFLGQQAKCHVVYSGLNLPSQTDKVATSADANFCPVCKLPLVYDAIYFSHLGNYHCPNNDFTRPKSAITVTNVTFTDHSISFVIDETKIDLPLPGIYNLYNAVSAIAAAQTLDLPASVIVQSLQSFTSAFGRVEEITIRDKKLRLFLIKNPTGCNAVLQTLSLRGQPYDQIVVGINDNFADGTDVSWLWDVDFEQLPTFVNAVTCTGIRAYDMAVRLKYAEHKNVTVNQSLTTIIDNFLISNQSELVILPTYTAMLELRKYLTAEGYIDHYLE